jgi:hypothetical protein
MLEVGYCANMCQVCPLHALSPEGQAIGRAVVTDAVERYGQFVPDPTVAYDKDLRNRATAALADRVGHRALTHPFREAIEDAYVTVATGVCLHPGPQVIQQES